MEKRVITVRNLRIGDGIPKICVPLVAENRTELESTLKCLQDVQYDLVEWRADFYQNVMEDEIRDEALRAVREACGAHPVLFTFRTSREGGSCAIETEEYGRMLLAVAKTGLADLIDVEVFRDETLTERLTAELRAKGCIVLGSNHDFDKTPDEEEIIRRLRRMQEMGVDITKIAVMPGGREDVLRLLHAAVRMEEQYADRPCVTMSMGKLGVLSRISGTFSGSAITFGTAGRTSAPGQIPAADLAKILQILSE